MLLVLGLALGIYCQGFCAPQALEYEVEGEVAWIGRNGKFVDGGSRTSLFSVTVSGGQWRIHLVPTNWPERIRFGKKVPRLLSCTMSSDGSNSYEIARYDPRDLSQSQIGERWPHPTPRGRGTIREMYPLWYAYASSDYVKGITNGTVMALEPGIDWLKGAVKINSAFPLLPKLIVATNSEQSHKWEFRVVSFTNMFDLSLPRHAIASYTALATSDEPWSTVNIWLRTARPKASMNSFILDFNPQPTVVYDSTYQEAKPSFTARIVTNTWPSASEIDARYEQMMIRQPKLRSKPNPITAYLLLGAVAMGPLLVFAIRLSRHRKTTNIRKSYE